MPPGEVFREHGGRKTSPPVMADRRQHAELKNSILPDAAGRSLP